MSLDVSLGPWKADSSTSRCEACGAFFNLFHRRHHCRCCGCIFCSSCTNQLCNIPTYPSLLPQRVCRGCHVLLAARESGRCQQRDRVLLSPPHSQPRLTPPQPDTPPAPALCPEYEDTTSVELLFGNKRSRPSREEAPAIMQSSSGG
ncbi:unspecified product [Leishmania tarentolae]|uniref:Unspecified product n=1 Tax=Leishmania tarentolae TaxID=5689 RepID=A0A640KIQ1_LEITA|nr:unspecified product [Leishmania tarentolae]